MAAAPSSAAPATSLFVIAGVLLVGLGAAWWADARPVEPARVTTPDEAEGVGPFARIVVVNEADGSIIYDERQPPSTIERIVSAELPCGSWQMDERTFPQRIWAARQASTHGTLCWLVRERVG